MLVVRRAPNPHYRAATSVPVVAARLATQRASGLDHVFVRGSGRGLGLPGGAGDGEILLERSFQGDDRVSLGAYGAASSGNWRWREMRFEARRRDWSGCLGDVRPWTPDPTLSLRLVRGAFVRHEWRGGGAASILAGAPSPDLTNGGPRVLAGGVEDIPTSGSHLAAAAAGFLWSGASAWTATMSEESPLLGGSARTSFSFQRHDLARRGASAASLGFDWHVLRTGYALTLSQRLASGRSLLLTVEPPVPAPERETALDGQVRFWRGRAETHASLTDIAGGDLARTWRSRQLGASTQLGGLAWYVSAHASWDRPGLAPATLSRVAGTIGRAGASGSPLLVRLTRTAAAGTETSWELSGQWSRAMGAGARFAVGPEATWRARALECAGLAVSASQPLPWPGARLTARLRLDAERDRDFRPRAGEASLAVALRPRPRDRWEAEVRRNDAEGLSGYEMTTSYDFERARYAAAPGTSRRGPADVTVRVLRGDGTGVEGVLVTLDGKDLRFTDRAGEAVFESVTPGLHELFVEERTLPAAFRVLGPTRRLISIERGRAPEPARFEIGRAERRTKF